MYINPFSHSFSSFHFQNLSNPNTTHNKTYTKYQTPEKKKQSLLLSIINLSIYFSIYIEKKKKKKNCSRAMCNPKPSSLNNPSFLPLNYKTNFMTTSTTPNNKKLDINNLNNNNNNLLKSAAVVADDDDDDQLAQLHRFPTFSEAVEEMKEIGKISGPSAITGLLLYSRAMISMLFLGYLGELELAGGSLSIGFANITGYSVLSGLAMGMEPICGQAYGAKQWKILGITLQRTILLLLTSSVPISFLWMNMNRILLWCGQDREIASVAQTFILFSIPDLVFLSLLHPLRIYLRAQSITLPLTYCSALSVFLHIPLNFLLVVHFKLGISGVAIAMVCFNFNVFLFLVSFVYFSGVYKDSWVSPSVDCLHGWTPLLSLAIPTCVSVCLEWWWYEFMIMLCGLLVNPKATIASMGILIQTTSLVYVFPSSLSLGVSTRIGNELGANRPAKARISMIVSLVCAAALGVAAMVFTTLMRHRWGRFFTNDSEILELTAVALPIVGLCELGNCPQTTGCGVLRGSARPTIGANINLGSFYLVGFPVAIVMGFVVKMGFAGLWIGLLAAQGSCALMMIYVLCKTDWMIQVERSMQLTKSSSSSSSSNCCNPPLLPISVSSEDHHDHDHEINGKKMGNLEENLCSNQESHPLITTTIH